MFVSFLSKSLCFIQSLLSTDALSVLLHITLCYIEVVLCRVGPMQYYQTPLGDAVGQKTAYILLSPVGSIRESFVMGKIFSRPLK